MAHLKIWKSILAKKLICPVFKSYEADPAKIRVFDATHELTRLDGRIKMAGIGWSLRDTEVPVENHIYKGRIDDVFARENEILRARCLWNTLAVSIPTFLS